MNRSEINGRNDVYRQARIIIKTHRDKTSLGIENNVQFVRFDGNTVILFLTGLLFKLVRFESELSTAGTDVGCTTGSNRTFIPVGLINAHAVRAGPAQASGSGVNVARAGAQQRRSRCDEKDDGDRHYRRWHLAFPAGIHCEEEKAEDGVEREKSPETGVRSFDSFQLCSVLCSGV